MTFSKLGTDSDTGQFVNLPKSARFQGLYIIGMQRMGKSGLMENLIMQDIDQQIGVCVLDPHGELIGHVLARLEPKKEKDVIFLDIKDYQHPFGLNLFTCSDLTNPLAVQKTVDQVRHIFEKLLGVSTETPLILEYLRNCTYTLVANPGYTMAEISLLLQDAECRKKLVAKVTDPDVLLFWKRYERMKPSEQDEKAVSILRRVQEFLQALTRPIVGQSTTTIDFHSIMDERKILLVKLDRTLDAVTTLIGSIIVALILNAAASRHTQRQFHLYADEFQNFATEDFAVLLEQAGKNAIGVTMAHQNRSQLELSNKQADANLKTRTLNVGNIVVFRVPTDASELAEQFDTTPPPAREEDITIIDGTEPIMTPVKDVVGHLLNGGSHPTSAVVNQFALSTLKTLEAAYARRIADVQRWNTSPPYPYMDALNTLLYEAMTQCNPNVFFPKIHDQYRYPNDYQRDWITQHIKDLLDAVNAYMYAELFDGHAPWKVRPYTTNPEEAYNALYLMWTRPVGSPNYTYGLQVLDGKINEMRNATIIEYKQQNKYDPLTEKIFQTYPQRIMQGRAAFLNFITEFKQVVEALATAPEPISVDSGFRQPHEKTQHIVHAQQSRADKEKEIAGHLLHLQKYTAWVKIAENIPLNPGKNCLKCGLLNKYGAHYCHGCGTHLPAPNEYIITTLQPPKGMQQLDQRIKRIQANNLREGYVKKREDVEKEIIQRQTQCIGAAPAQPQLLQPSPQQQSLRHARQVPLQGKCPNCGFSNNPTGSKFCNQCGTKL